MSVMENGVFVVNDDLCSGCRNCEMWCSFIHGKEGTFDPVQAKIRILKDAEGIRNVPTVDCSGGNCPRNEIGEPICVEMCPTGTLVFTDVADLYQKRLEWEESKRLQPLFRLIVPWKYPYPWKPWSEETF